MQSRLDIHLLAEQPNPLCRRVSGVYSPLSLYAYDNITDEEIITNIRY